MKILDKMKNVDPKSVLTIASAAVMGVVAFTNALSDQKKAQEFEDMKKSLQELKSK